MSAHRHFICPGASRSGTTTLYHALKTHPDIYLTDKKELRFFFDEEKYAQGFDTYLENFRQAGSDQICGDISPPYFHKGLTLNEGAHRWAPDDDCALRIHRHFGDDVKILITLRNPVERLYSQVMKNIVQGREDYKALSTIVREELDRKRPPKDTALCWLYNNCYSIHLSNWMDFFDKAAIKVIIFDEWTKNPAGTVNEIERFLNVAPRRTLRDEDIQPRNAGRSPVNKLAGYVMKPLGKLSLFRQNTKRHFSKAGYEPLDHENRVWLHDILKQDIQEVEKLLGREIPAWHLNE